MGGGKTKALCEEALDAALQHPGIEIVVGRKEHTAIARTTRKTFFREVLPPVLEPFCRVISSGGEDFIQFPNGPSGTTRGGSTIHFAGLDDPVKWNSSELGLLAIDEAHEVEEDTVQLLNTRLRQKCRDCLEKQFKNCDHLPRQILCGFNPENPGHWLWAWFVDGAEKTAWGYYKRELRLDEFAESLGSAIFVRALPTDNPYLPKGYIERELAGMKEFQRKRYLEGEC